MKLTVTLLALLVCTSVSSRAALLINGGFESPDIPTSTASDFTTIPGWTISGNIDLLDTLWQPAEGQQVIDIVGDSGPGTFIEQAFSTTPGLLYRLTFQYANNVDTTTATGNILLTGTQALFNQNFSHSGSTAVNMNWTLFSTDFTADAASTVLRFTHVTSPVPDSRGVAIDAVDVQLVPEPTTGLLCLFSFVALCAFRIRPNA